MTLRVGGWGTAHPCRPHLGASHFGLCLRMVNCGDVIELNVLPISAPSTPNILCNLEKENDLSGSSALWPVKGSGCFVLAAHWLDFGAMGCLLKSRAFLVAKRPLFRQLYSAAATPAPLLGGSAWTTIFPSYRTLLKVARSSHPLQNADFFSPKSCKVLSSVRICTLSKWKQITYKDKLTPLLLSFLTQDGENFRDPSAPEHSHFCIMDPSLWMPLLQLPISASTRALLVANAITSPPPHRSS